jgi:hypothetical protein
MARMIGRSGSWLWWAFGAICALVFGADAMAGQAAVRYGVAPRPPVDNPAVTEEQKQKAEKLVADYLAPVPAAEPAAEQKAAIEKLIKDLASNDFKVREEASANIVKQGPAALGVLREAAKSTDAEVATRAAAAIVAIEKAAHQAQVDDLKKLGTAGSIVINQEVAKARTAWAEANTALQAAEKKGDKDAVEKAKAASKASLEKMNVLNGLMALVSPMRMQPVYGAVALYGIRPQGGTD